MLKSNIGWLLNREGLKREYLAKRYNKSRNTISNWCTGKSKPTVDELFDLALLLKVKVDDLYEREEASKKGHTDHSSEAEKN